MNVPLWVAELADTYWTRAKCVEPFPRTLRRSVERGFPLTVCALPGLSIREANAWLTQQGIVCALPGRNRPLLACLIARDGHGIAILDSDASEEEARFSLAHEIAHYLKDYWFPRTKAERSLGAAVLEVLDGKRPPSPDERLHALLRHVQLGFHVHLMERDTDGSIRTRVVAKSEADADRLAYELLAPAEYVLKRCTQHDHCALEARLRCDYGLPELQALRYARILLPPAHTDPLILRLKGIAKT